MRVLKNKKTISLAIAIVVFFVSCSIFSLVDTTSIISDETTEIDDNKNLLRNSALSPVFDGMYVNYTFGADYPGYSITNFSYSHFSGNMFNQMVNTEGWVATWFVDIQTRIMSGGSAFSDGSHDPIWIFTNASLGDTIPIAVDGVGDHSFLVSDELIYDLPSYGPIDVWELEDLTLPGGVAWYEKSTGLLINGTFFYDGGSSNYTFSFIETNVIFPVVGFFDDFESGLSKWQSITGLWHLTDTGSAWPDPCHSPTHAMWFGNESTGTYDTGLQEYGELVSIPFSLIGFEVATLKFYHWRDGEGEGWDVSFINISIDGINWDLLYENDTDYFPPWECVSLDISGYVGNPSVQLMFSFDTIDEELNDYRGWLVDDILVIGSTVPPGPLTLSSDAGIPDDDGSFNLSWTAADAALTYSVYEYSDFINQINGSLTLLASGFTNLTLPLSSYSNGIYYFVVMAQNDYGDTLSNCIKVEVLVAGGDGEIPSYNLYIVIGLVCIVSVILFKKRFKLIR